MYMPVNNGGGDFAPPPAGTHVAVCYRVIDLGTQKVEWQGQAKFQRKVLLSWEIPAEQMEDGRPFTISKRYTFSSSEKAALRHDLESWRGKRFTDADFGPGGFDIMNVLGKGCMLSIVHNEKDGKTYANITSVSALPKGFQAPTLTNETLYFSLERERFDRDALGKLSEHIQTVIRNSPEYADVISADRPAIESYSTGADPDDEIPF